MIGLIIRIQTFYLYLTTLWHNNNIWVKLILTKYKKKNIGNEGFRFSREDNQNQK